jgi:2-amino-4-hydroxy-6-hydroxymethyldihydropteridine diphosphokinase
MAKHQLFLSLGGNLGNKNEIFAETLARINTQIGTIKALSSPYESVAWGFRSKHLFRNQVVKVGTDLSPEEVLKNIRTIENHFGRVRKPGKYLSRKMDIDILFYDDLQLCSEDLIIPHPLLAERKFVLIPFLEIDPEFIHPVLNKSIREICPDCPDHSSVGKIFP